MQQKAITAKVTTYPVVVSVTNKKNWDTTQFETQLVVVATELPAPLKWRGQISELIVHGVQPREIEKKAKYSRMPANETHFPASQVLGMSE